LTSLLPLPLPPLLQVQTVAANTGLDRTQVLAWVAAFRSKSKQEQAALLAPLAGKVAAMKEQQAAATAAATAAEAQRRAGTARNNSSSSSSSSVQAAAATADAAAAAAPTDGPQPQQQQQQQHQQRQQQQLPFSSKNADTGFLPFNELRSQRAGGSSTTSSASAGTRRGRLPGEVLRSLEGVYSRSPWPNREVVSGLFDLHRLSRWVVGGSGGGGLGGNRGTACWPAAGVDVCARCLADTRVHIMLTLMSAGRL
jgi:hypothetical protein